MEYLVQWFLNEIQSYPYFQNKSTYKMWWFFFIKATTFTASIPMFPNPPYMEQIMNGYGLLPLCSHIVTNKIIRTCFIDFDISVSFVHL